MKLGIGTIVILGLILLGLWQSDVANDKEYQIKVTTAVPAFSDWECGYSNQPECSVVFELSGNRVIDVHRIRYGKDFMAIKVKLNELYGWVILGKGVKLIANPNTS